MNDISESSSSSLNSSESEYEKNVPDISSLHPFAFEPEHLKEEREMLSKNNLDESIVWENDLNASEGSWV